MFMWLFLKAMDSLMHSLKGCARRLWNSLASTANKTGCQQPTWQHSCEDPVLSWTRQLYQLIWSQHHRDNMTLEQFLCYFDGLVQERRNSIANALELRLSCATPSTFPLWGEPMGHNSGFLYKGHDVELCLMFSLLLVWRCWTDSEADGALRHLIIHVPWM